MFETTINVIFYLLYDTDIILSQITVNVIHLFLIKFAHNETCKISTILHCNIDVLNKHKASYSN